MQDTAAATQEAGECTEPRTDVTLLLLRGLPGSGKSTFARTMLEGDNRGKWKRINKDTLREMLDLDDWGPYNEHLLNQMVFSMAKHYLKAGFNVVSDNMNLDKAHFKSAANISRTLSEDGVKVFVDHRDFKTPTETCIERDSKRPKPVTGDVIRKIEAQYMPEGTMPDVSAYVGYHTTKVPNEG